MLPTCSINRLWTVEKAEVGMNVTCKVLCRVLLPPCWAQWLRDRGTSLSVQTRSPLTTPYKLFKACSDPSTLLMSFLLFLPASSATRGPVTRGPVMAAGDHYPTAKTTEPSSCLVPPSCMNSPWPTLKLVVGDSHYLKANTSCISPIFSPPFL